MMARAGLSAWPIISAARTEMAGGHGCGDAGDDQTPAATPAAARRRARRRSSPSRLSRSRGESARTIGGCWPNSQPSSRANHAGAGAPTASTWLHSRRASPSGRSERHAHAGRDEVERGQRSPFGRRQQGLPAHAAPPQQLLPVEPLQVRGRPGRPRRRRWPGWSGARRTCSRRRRRRDTAAPLPRDASQVGSAGARRNSRFYIRSMNWGSDPRGMQEGAADAGQNARSAPGPMPFGRARAAHSIGRSWTTTESGGE